MKRFCILLISLALCATVAPSSEQVKQGQGDLVCSESLCEFDFVVALGRTMTYRHPGVDGLFTVVLGEDGKLTVGESMSYPFRRFPEVQGKVLQPEDVILADGVARNVLTINGQFPGPNVHVTEDATVIIRVHNKLFREAVTVHFHGIEMTGTVWSDGTPYVSQCPILPGQSFVHRFRASPAGTHWYHSHMGGQRLEGMYGAFVVHHKRPMHDLSPAPFPDPTDHVLIVADWYHMDIATLEQLGPFSTTPDSQGPGMNRPTGLLPYTSGLINGRGRHQGAPVPYSTFRVQPGTTHRFRVVHTGAEYAYELSIDRHRLQVVASDGQEIQPIDVDSVVLTAGETLDFTVRTNQRHGRYWLRARVMIGETGFFLGTVEEVKAIIIYEDAAETKPELQSNIKLHKPFPHPVPKSPRGFCEEEPSSVQVPCGMGTPCVSFNCPFRELPKSENKLCIPMSEAKKADPDAHYRYQYGLDEPGYDVEEMFLQLGMRGGPNINGHKLSLPGAPYSQLLEARTSETTCSHQQCPDDAPTCKCTHSLTLPHNKVFQLVITGVEPNNIRTFHNLHLHGHRFAVVKMGHGTFNFTSWDVQEPAWDVVCGEGHVCNWRSPHHVRGTMNLNDPPLKDTVQVPTGGYVVIRFRANNPGFWLLHCHQEVHLFEGMSLILEEDVTRLPPVPIGFPTCHSFDKFLTEENTPLLAAAAEASANTQGTSGSGGVSLTLSVLTAILLLAAIVGLAYLLVMKVFRSRRSRTVEVYKPLLGSYGDT